MSSDIDIKNWCPAENLSQGLGDDGMESGEQFIWKHLVAAELGDGQGNKISMTEAIQKLLALP